MWEETKIKIILCCLYGVLATVGFVVLVRVYRALPSERCRVALHILVVVAALVRFIENVIPVTVYTNIRENFLWLQVLMDLFPELLFWQTFVMLVLLWVEVYHFSRNKAADPTIWSKVSLMGLFAIFSGIAYTCAFGFSILMQFTNDYKLIAEAIFLTILTSAAMIVFMHYGYLTHKRMDRVPLFPPHRKTKRLNRLKITVISVVVCNAMHIIYLYVVDSIKALRKNEDEFLWIWMCYFIVTEILPASAIVFVFRKAPQYNKKARNSVLNKHVPSSVGQYQPIPYYAVGGYSPSASPNLYAPIQDFSLQNSYQ